MSYIERFTEPPEFAIPEQSPNTHVCASPGQLNDPARLVPFGEKSLGGESRTRTGRGILDTVRIRHQTLLAEGHQARAVIQLPRA